jgi:hypothetical protein
MQNSRMRKGVKRAVGAGLVGGIAYAAWRAWRARVPERPRDIEWQSAPFPFPPVPRPGASAWREPREDGACPMTHPIKGKLTSGIYHMPGCANYDRTQPDRCYVDEDAASRDGLRRSKV